MPTLIEFLKELEILIPIIRTIVILTVIFTIFTFLLKYIKKSLLKRVKTKAQITNVKIFTRVLQYAVLLILVLFAIFTFVGSWAGLGIGLGLFTAALGFALQKPISGVAAWIMIVTKRPFQIGDRVIMDGVKGDVYDITLSHIYLKEIGGTVESEETSGRFILVPNSVVYEKNIINYTTQDENILTQVPITITYESNIDKAMKVTIEVANKILKKYLDKVKDPPFSRASFVDSGINIKLRFFTPTALIQDIKSDITTEVFKRIRSMKDVEFAYPHREIIMRKK
tara:strand:+ start:381 stop:1229 length:849 start_codon:yes stop_codon:yes gene_type:complete